MYFTDTSSGVAGATKLYPVGKFSSQNTQFWAGNPPILGESRDKIKILYFHIFSVGNLQPPAPSLLNPGRRC